ncbi:probable pre-mRNA-splicing factor ATP-dependent RNA helicase DEAH9 [Carica papaya]|uniref:probable pre-mRNA-splicing factor ATP-dependent RNA helicase DEAH9 n=1 Tax=Carica papaya TaxID=3649 RepID=UPI000B8C704B|nr:probable pre-mRNA-splicing factor ATP-dependent RNA helicase DEAH9 [Carica papaya]
MSQFWRPGTEKPRFVDDEEGGVVFLSPSATSFSSTYGHASIEKQRQRLPVYKYKTAILYLVETHATTIIVGETGSGKTTQIPQYLKEAGWADGGHVVACTQPRRLAVQSVASRVAEEMGVKLGEEVGYTIRFEDLTNPAVTMIKFLTDGVLLREMMDDPLLSKYSVIMVDEAHERSISTDILLGLLKKIQRRRPDLRLIISSATIEAKSMSNFFQSRINHSSFISRTFTSRSGAGIFTHSWWQEESSDINKYCRDIIDFGGMDLLARLVKLVPCQSSGIASFR